MTERARRIIDTLINLDPLADLPRTGWLLRGIRPCESIADHSLGVALCTMLMVDALREEGQTIDGEKALRMALIHDAPEAFLGDIPSPVKTPELDAALTDVEAALAERILPSGLAKVWQEMERGQTIEACLVKAADKIHMMVKVLVYGEQKRGSLDGFWRNERNFKDRGLSLAKEVFDVLRTRLQNES